MRQPVFFFIGAALFAQASCAERDSAPLIEAGSTRILSADTATNIGTVKFALPNDTDARLQIQIRGPLMGSDVTLTAPSGRVRVTPDEVKVIPSAELGNPRLGDLAELPHILEPEGGTWRLEIDQLSQEKAIFAFITLAAGHQVTLYTDGSVFSVAQPVLVQVNVIELGGVSDMQPAAIQVRHLEQDRVTEVPLRPQQELIGVASAGRTPTLLAVWHPTRTGAFELRVELRSNGNTVAEASRTVNVVAAPIRVLAVRPPSSANRGSAHIAVEVRTSGRYTFEVTYTDRSGRQHQDFGTWRLDQGKTRVAVPLDEEADNLRQVAISLLKDGQSSLVIREDLGH